MLFPTAVFAFGYLPLVWLGFFLIGSRSPYAAATWLFAASVFFYGYWMPEFTLLLLLSIVFNYGMGRWIAQRVADTTRPGAAKALLATGITVDLIVLAYYKYANFFLDSLNAALGSHVALAQIVLPIGISFYTFTQIAFLADAYSKGIREVRFAHYGLFVTYFPHLVAGPVLHHAQMMPQFALAETYRPRMANVAAGLAIFAIGLFKKVVLADGVAPYADTVFEAADGGRTPTAVEGWLGALAYTFQIYFDFSGYSDMAIGLSLLFNIRLPLNFASPYQSRDIVEFWRRWHISLSTFLRDYLYVPLGGNRRGPTRRHINLMLTMLLGGLWHGASWTFVFWGGLHGTYLVVNHGFSNLRGAWLDRLRASRAWSVAALAITFLCVVIAWVFFRAHTFPGAAAILAAMAGMGPEAPMQAVQPLLWNAGLDPWRAVAWCVVGALIAFLAPNSNVIGDAIGRLCRERADLRAATLGAALAAAVFLIVLNESREAVSAFIYFNF